MTKKAAAKITAGLNEALARVSEPTPYEQLASRVLAAVEELNKALQAAHEMAEMRVFLAQRPRSADHAMRFEPQIFRMTHSTMTFVITPAASTMEWRQVKDMAFQDAAGQGLTAFDQPRRKRGAEGVPGAG